MSLNFEEVYKISQPYTVTSRARMERLYKSVVYVNENNIAGSFVECGVYKGGSVMNMALTQLNFSRREHIYLFDTFEGMTPETEHDVNHQGVSARRILRNPSKKCVYGLDDVKKNLGLTGYPKEFLHFHKGDVAVTLLDPKNLPEKIAILRLDTDWYESTKVELEVLYPKLVPGGVLILDDYGYWKGARKATDEYFAAAGIQPNFLPIDEGVGAVYFQKPK